MPEMEQQIGVNHRTETEQVVFDTRRGEISLSVETGMPGASGEVWVARGWNGLRHGTDPAVTLERFVPPARAERMAGAAIAFSQIEVPIQ